MKLKLFIQKHLGWAYRPFTDYIKKRQIADYRAKQVVRFAKMSPKDKHVFYLGITEQPNLGDMAQHYCIKNWIQENYPDRILEMFEASVIVDPRFTQAFFAGLKNVFREDDIIIFQSGYCTHDLSVTHPLMHQLVCEHMPHARILMMPQTIFFKKEENKRICAANHNQAKNMLFLARDFVSYNIAKEMFTQIRVKAYPDIVTTLIGTMKFNNPREGVCICTRNDGEKLYSYDEISNLTKRIEADGSLVTNKDTKGKRPYTEIRANLQKFIGEEIETYSHYEVTITDRYHGTIFSLCAGTPVIIIKTTDHKVITGADWFKGVYDDYVYVAKDLDDAFLLYKQIMNKPLPHKLQPYFKIEYYDKLKSLFENNH